MIEEGLKSEPNFTGLPLIMIEQSIVGAGAVTAKTQLVKTRGKTSY